MTVRRYLPWISILGLAAFLLLGSFSKAAAARIGVVNVHRVLSRSKAGRAAQAELDKEERRLKGDIQSRKAALEGLGKQVQDLQLEIQQRSAIWREEERERKTSELRRRRRDLLRGRDELKRMVQESQRDFAERRRKIGLKVFKEIRDVVHQIGKEGKYDMIIDVAAGSILFAAPKINITEKVIRLYDRKKK